MSHLQSAVLFSIFLCICCLAEAHAQVRLSPEEANKLVIEAPAAVYPEIAKVAQAKGPVKVETIISDEGLVTSARAISGHPLLQNAAVNAVKKRKYKPYTIGGKQAAFITDVFVLFPPGTLTREQREKYEQQTQLANQYFEERDRCSNLTKTKKWKEAEQSCRHVVTIADQLSEDRSLEKMGANELLGHVLVGQSRYNEAIEYYNRALKVVGSTLTEENAELGQLYGHLAIAHHLLRDLDKARELYKKAEKIYQLAYSSIGDGDSDEWVDNMRLDYMKALRTLLGYHLKAAEHAGATSEVEEIKKLMKSLP